MPCPTSSVPDFSNCSGPTKLGFWEEGGGPKYDSGTVVPMDAGAGNRLHPGPGPIGPGPGPCAALKFDSAAVCTAGIAGWGLLWDWTIFGVVAVPDACEVSEVVDCPNAAAPNAVASAINWMAG